MSGTHAELYRQPPFLFLLFGVMLLFNSEAKQTTRIKMRPTKSASSKRIVARADVLTVLSNILNQCGFAARIWKQQRIYLSHYGRDIRAFLAPRDPEGALPADGWDVIVTSSWRAPQYNGLRCKGVKHAILVDLFVAGLISTPPPARWQDVQLDSGQTQRPPITRYDPQGGAAAAPTVLPARQSLDPYASLRAIHQKCKGA